MLRWAPRWIYFAVFVHYNVSVMAIFGPPSSTPAGDRHMRLLTFLYGIQCSTTFIWSIVGYNAYFGQHCGPKWIYFVVFVPYNFSNTTIFGPLCSTPGGDRHMRPRTFLYEIQCSTTFILNIFGYIAYFWQCQGLKWIYLAVFVFLCLQFLSVLKIVVISFTSTWELLFSRFSINISGWSIFHTVLPDSDLKKFSIVPPKVTHQCQWKLLKMWRTFATKLWVVTQLQPGSCSFEHAVVESLSIIVICYHFLLKKFEENYNNYLSDCVFPYFPIERVDTSHQSPAI